MITLAKTCTAFGEIAILQSRLKGSRIYCQEDWFQSEADRNGVSLAGYVHAIFGLIAQTIAREVLMIGCGGGTLGTMLSRAGRLGYRRRHQSSFDRACAAVLLICLGTSPAASRMALHF